MLRSKKVLVMTVAGSMALTALVVTHEQESAHADVKLDFSYLPGLSETHGYIKTYLDIPTSDLKTANTRADAACSMLTTAKQEWIFTEGYKDAAMKAKMDKAFTDSQLLGLPLPTGSLSTLSSPVKCKYALIALRTAVTGAHKTNLLGQLSKVRFTPTLTSTRVTFKPNNIDRDTVKTIVLEKANSRWHLADGLQHVAGLPGFIPVPEAYACLVEDPAQQLLCKLESLPPKASCSDVSKLLSSATKSPLATSSSTVDSVLSSLVQICECEGVPANKLADKNAIGKLADIDGDGLSNLTELKLMHKRPEAFHVCKRDSDSDGIPDAMDLVPDAKGGIKLDIRISKILQGDKHDGNGMDGPPGMPAGRGDPWVPKSGAFLGPGNARTGTKRIEIAWHGLSANGKFPPPLDDPPSNDIRGYGKPQKPFTLIKPVELTADVREYASKTSQYYNKAYKPPSVQDIMGGKSTTPAPFDLGVPSIALTVLFLDWDSNALNSDSGCNNEVYAPTQPDVKLCAKDSAVDLVAKWPGINLLIELFGAQNSLREIAATAGTAAKDVLAGEAMCVPSYGIKVCFEVRATDSRGRPLDACSLGLASTAWKQSVDKVRSVLDVGSLPGTVIKACEMTK